MINDIPETGRTHLYRYLLYLQQKYQLSNKMK